MQTILGSLLLEHPVMVAAGMCKTRNHASEATQSLASAIVVGSYTPEERTGNEGNVYYEHWENSTLLYTLNSLGLPNGGQAALERDVPYMVTCAHESGKKLFVSVVGFSPKEYGEMARAAACFGADGIEINCGCPNVWAHGEQEEIVSYAPRSLVNVLYAVEAKLGNLTIPWWVKLSPFSKISDLKIAAGIIAQSKAHGVTATNTLGNSLFLRPDGTSVITPNRGLAGLAGPALKPIALANVRELRNLLPDSFFVIGCGGIMNGQDVLDYLHAGATAVQVGSAYASRGNNGVNNIIVSYLELIS